MKRSVTLLSALLLAGFLTGCGDKLLVATPAVTVDGVELTSRTDEGVRALLHLTLANSGDVPLPMTFSSYTVTLAGVKYSGGTNPNATLPAKGTQSITLPAAVAASPAEVPDGCAYTVSGSVTYRPPGQIRQVLTDMGFPLPSVGFTSKGTTTGSPAVHAPLGSEPDTKPGQSESSSAAPGEAAPTAEEPQTNP